MSALAHRLLDVAARRWPAEIRDEMAREWHAELAALEAEPGGARNALGYAVSLVLSPPFKDRTGAPRGWAEATGPLAPAGALILAGLLTLGVTQLGQSLTRLVLDDAYVSPWPFALADGVVTAVWCVLAGRWLGRRMPLEPTARLGPATSAAFAPLLLAPALLAPAVTDQDLFFALSLLAGLLVWIPGTAALGVVASRSRRRAVPLLLGTPLIAATAAVVATLPMALTSDQGLLVAAASLTGGMPPEEYFAVAEGDLTGRAFYATGPWAVTLVAFAVLALTFGLAALRPLPHRMPAAAEPASGREPRSVAAVGAAGVALAVVAWAYTLTILTPAMPHVSETAPMPGGDGEIYLWVAELRWGAILIAALALLIATADRRRAVPAALVLGAALIVANGILIRAGVTGAGGLRLALLIGGVAVVAAWFVAGGPLAGAVRRRVAAGAVIAAACAPLLLGQGTPGVNHPFLPAGLRITTTGLAVLGVLLAAISAVTVARGVPRWAALALIVLPAAVVAVAGLAPVPATSEDTGHADLGVLAGLPLAVLVVALLRRHRTRARGRTAALWTALTLAALPASVVLVVAAIFLTQVAPNLLFATEGLGYPADGLSMVPGAALLITPIAAILSVRLDGVRALGHQNGPRPAPDPLPG